jgi:hypothetical protein
VVGVADARSSRAATAFAAAIADADDAGERSLVPHAQRR